jgi:hypothetical protein
MPRPVRVEPLPRWRGDAPTIVTGDDLDSVLGLLAEIAPKWSAELNCAGPNDATIVILPEGANDLVGPAFVLHRSDGRVRLDQFRWDEYRKLGGFLTLDEALAVLRTRLVPWVAGSGPVSNSDQC